MCFFFLAFPMYFFCLLQASPQNSGSKIFRDQLSIFQTLKQSSCLTLESKMDIHFIFSCHNKENVSNKVTNFVMLKDNEPNPFNSTRKHQFHFSLLGLPISYVKHYFRFFSLVFNHFSLNAHIPISLNNCFMKKMFKFSETVQVLMYNFFILGFFLLYEVKYLINKLKTSEKKKHKNVLIFVMFFMKSFQLFYDNSTLTILNSNDFNVINQYKNDTKFIIISEGIYSIPSSSFSGWSSVVSVDFGKSVSDIGGSVFSSCLSFEIIIFGENVTTIGDSAFSLCSSIKNITIPNSVTAIGSSSFSTCTNLRILTLGYGIKEIGNSAFGNCYNLQCIYYYGATEPNIGESAFYNVAATVITYPTYANEKFGSLEVVQSVEGNCNAISTISFSASHAFSRSDTYSVSNTFSLSNTFTGSFQNDITFSYSYTLTYTLTIAYSISYFETQTKSFSLSLYNSTFSYLETEFVYYDYTVIMYSTHFNYFSNFITMFRTNISQSNGLTTNALIGIICGSIAFVLIIVGIVIFLIKSSNQKEKSTSKLQFKNSTTSSTKQMEDVNTLVEDIVKEDEDNWL